MFRRSKHPERSVATGPAKPTDDPAPCNGEFMFVSPADIVGLNVDCVLDFGSNGRMPVTLAVELADDPSLAAYEQSLLTRWTQDCRHVDASLLVRRTGPRLTLTAEDDTKLTLGLRTAGTS